MQPKLIVHQKITALVNKYSVYQANPDGSAGQLAAFAQQKRFSFKEKVNFYSDEAKQQLVFSFRAEKVLDIHGRFFVEDAEGRRIGAFRKDFGQSMARSTWHILDNSDQTQLTVTETNEILALARRFSGFLPIVGDLIQLATSFIKYHFSFLDSEGQEVGKYLKTTLMRYHYRLEMNDDIYQSVDWRVLASVAVALDALQSR